MIRGAAVPDDFILRAALAGLGLAVAAGPLGCFIVWRRMALFGDAAAHGTLLGVALSLGLALPLIAGTLAAALLMALAVSALWARGHSMDTALSVLSHSALAVGLVAVSFVPGRGLGLEAYLFGDILALSARDVAVIWGGALLALGLLAWRWQALLTATLNPELARASGVHPQREQLILTVALALVVAVSVQVVGALLIAAMLVIPAAAARSLARDPEPMALLAVGAGALSALAGLGASWQWDTPAGPSIAAAAAGIFALAQLRRP